MSIKVVDLFAGPGGLGEGFSSCRDSQGSPQFGIVLSVERDSFAHQTLELRAFYRRFPAPPPMYWQYLRGECSRTGLFGAHPRQAAAAAAEAKCLALGRDTAERVRTLIADRTNGDESFVLVGGPPCQAYSVIGRSRNRGVVGYVPEKDERQTLYIEYLQVLADHAPAVFVMENVKGLLSATLNRQRLFDRIREDLSNPAAALARDRRQAHRRPRYRLYPLVAATSLLPGEDPRDFVIRAEEYGIPQARHRVIILGVREDLSPKPGVMSRRVSPTVEATLNGLPRLRSGLSDSEDSRDAWLGHLRSTPRQPWYHELPSDLRKAVDHALGRLRAPRADRGREFLEVRHGSGIAELGGVVNHVARSHLGADVHRYLFASTAAAVMGRSPELPDFPKALLPAHRNVGKALAGGHFADRFRVQLADRPASTVTSHIAKDGHYYIHHDPTQCRSLTVREAARLQTFPEDYFFCGPRTAQYQQVGNAVPVALASQIAAIVRGLL